MKGAQIGGTECGNNWLGYIMHKAPGPIMAVSPTVEMAKRNSRQRIDPLIEDCPALKNLVSSPRSRDKGNTMLSKDFQGGVFGDDRSEFGGGIAFYARSVLVYGRD